DLNSLKSGKSKGCQACSQPKQIPIWLEKRLSAAKQRCINPRDPNYKNYGAWVKIISAEKHWNQKQNHCYV
ncbi:hypothetical protein BFS05_06670, partial [Gardnerella vaginalis]